MSKYNSSKKFILIKQGDNTNRAFCAHPHIKIKRELLWVLLSSVTNR